MALRNLVEGECGAANPLVQWTSHFTQEKSMLKGGLDHDRLADLSAAHGDQREHQMVNEFLTQQRPAVPQTFHMGSLLQSIQQPQAHSADVHVKDWVSEYSRLPAPLHTPHTVSDTWVKEFEQLPSSEAQEWVSEFAPVTQDQQWAKEFEQSTKDPNNLSMVAKEITDTVTDPEIQATEFMDFVKRVASGDVTLGDKEELVGDGTDWPEEFEKDSKSGNGGFWNELEKEWNDLAKQDSHPWLSEFEHQQKYVFQEDNHLRNVSQPLEEGMKKLEEGDLPSAVLLFEAEVQARPESVKGWQYLGSTQADNEQDLLAIAALHKCLELEPDNLPAHMALAVSYTNESQQTKALEALKGWLKHNQKYAPLLSTVPPPSDRPFAGSLMTREEHAKVRDLYLSAAQTSPDQIDYSVQVGLGVLFNLSHEYDKAVDCFSSALDIRPNDAMLWNKLGATLANGNRSEEAVSAYRKALEIMPGFTRCRYNLGVSCINLGAHRESAEHFLTALNMQRQAKGPQGSKAQMSESIWGTLRIAITFLGRHNDLNGLIDSRDIEGLMREFGL